MSHIATTPHTAYPHGSLASRLADSPFQAYAYAYPHKTAYRPLDPPQPLTQVWHDEDTRSLFLYIHVPFCEMRCGFCNLFTMAKPDESLHSRFIDTLIRQARATRDALDLAAQQQGHGQVRIARVAIGGGTPTQLDIRSLNTLLSHIAGDIMGSPMSPTSKKIPIACEVSPETTTQEKIDALIAHGVTRVSIGVQSFLEQETRAVRRPQDPKVLDDALRIIRDAPFEERNIDLIYGIQGQTSQSWDQSLRRTIDYAPEEIFLYPLYVRPLTGLGNSPRSWDDWRFALYTQGRDSLLAHGYTQRSMRRFVRADHAPATQGPDYHPARDPMVGLGPGARSYTRDLHYSSQWAIGRRSVVSIIHDWIERTNHQLAHADYGFQMPPDEQRRRFVSNCLLADGGSHTLDLTLYKELFSSALFDDLPQLHELHALKLITSLTPDTITLTQAGLDAADVIGPWLNSPAVEALMQDFEVA
jgi:oxygen-independent coproporphyrinogen-3 oxidase